MAEAVAEELYQCDLTESYVVTEEHQVVRVYGLALYNCRPERACLRGESCRVEDISDDREKVLRLKRLIDELRLYPVHLREVVEDYLS